MSNLEVPIEGPVPIDGIVRELLPGASAGFNGEVRVKICITVESDGRECSYDVDKPGLEHSSPDPERIAKVRTIAERIVGLLRHREGTFRVIGFFNNGNISKFRMIE